MCPSTTTTAHIQPPITNIINLLGLFAVKVSEIGTVIFLVYARRELRRHFSAQLYQLCLSKYIKGMISEIITTNTHTHIHSPQLTQQILGN